MAAVDLTLEEVDAVRAMVLSRDGCVPSVVARIDGWSALHTPLLLIVDQAGGVHLYGPDGAATGFTRAMVETRLSLAPAAQ